VSVSVAAEIGAYTMNGKREQWVGFSLLRVSTIALNTLTESVRQKFYLVLILFALVMIASASFFSQFGFGRAGEQEALEQLKFIKDFSLGAIAVFGMLIAVIGTAQLIPAELEHRTIYTILAKPVRRSEFLLGKYLGSAALLLFSVVVMSLMFVATLKFKGDNYLRRMRQMVVQTEDRGTVEEIARQATQIRAAMYDPDLLKAVLLAYMKLALLAAITLLVSTFSTSMVFTVAVTLMIFFSGHLVGAGKERWGNTALGRFLLALIPDLGVFNEADDVVLGDAIPWSYVGKVAVYGGIYLVAVLVASHLIFARREI
ncbi:MAG: ABC transporter permease, partial [Verrucomicrobiae bacterium]|nr:ABC transporter permease [Verrucomicrobiae bacterium]